MNARNWTRYFKEHEIKVLDAFAAVLPPMAREKFAKQLTAVKGVQRHGDGTDVNLYSKKFFKLTQLDCEAFIAMPEELHVATLYPLGLDDTSLQAKIWFVEGRPFTIEFQGTGAVNIVVEWRCELNTDFPE